MMVSPPATWSRKVCFRKVSTVPTTELRIPAAGFSIAPA
jgi:hypothetical protein